MNVAFEKMTSAQEIYDLLIGFESIFTHLREKITSFEDYADKLSKKAEVVKSIIEGNSCGILVYYKNDQQNQVAYISLIGVLEEYRGKNVADLLLEYCQSDARQAGMTKIKLEVDIDNCRAIAFYRKKGFEKVGNAGEQSIYMQKSIIKKDKK